MLLSLDSEPVNGASLLPGEIKSVPMNPFSMLPNCLCYRVNRDGP